MQRILKYNKDKADELIARIKAEVAEIDKDLANMVAVTINWFEFLIQKYGADHPRLTEIRNFDTIEASKVVEANEKLYINRAEGFIGTGLKKDEFICNCSDIDDIIIFYRDGKYKIVRVADKLFVGKNVLWAQVFKKNDTRTVFNVVYRDGRHGPCYYKRFSVTSCTRDKEYDLTQGTAGSKVMYFTANPNGEAEVIKVTLEPDSSSRRGQNIFLERDFSNILIKNRSAKGNLLTKKPVHRISLKSRGHSTLGGRKVWYEPSVRRINYEERGEYLGEFSDDDRILILLDDGSYYFTNFDANNHYGEGIRTIEKWEPHKVWTALLYDEDNKGYLYIKRFEMEYARKQQSVLGDNPKNRLVLLTDTAYPRIRVSFGGADAVREPMEIDAESFIAVKGIKAHGKRVTTYEIVESLPIVVIKKDGSRQTFDRAKVLNGMVRACEKRPVSMAALEAAGAEIEQSIQNSLEREISTEQIGELVMERLKPMDEVSYVRFASVYRQFKDIESFKKLIDEL